MTFSLSGGADAALFNLTPQGSLTFKAPPDFEAPADANADNIYQVQITASDGVRQATLSLSVQVMNVFEATTLVARTSYQQPSAITPIPGTNRLFVAEQSGAIYRYDPAGAGSNELYLTVPGVTYTAGSDRGLLNIVAAPDYAESGLLYTVVASDTELQLRRYRRTTAGLGDAATAEILMRIAIPVPAPQSPLSSYPEGPGGGLVFGPDGLLYFATGTAGGIADRAAAQDLQSLRGKLLRIDVSRDDFPGDATRNYGIPAGNPYAGSGSTAPEIMAIGLANPRSAVFTDIGLLVGISFRPSGIPRCCNSFAILFRPQDAGANYGYGAPAGTSIIPPVIKQEIVNGEGGYMVLGGVYRGIDPTLQGRLLFADPLTQFLFSVPLTSIVQGTTLTNGAYRYESGLQTGAPTTGYRDFAFMDDGTFYALNRPQDGANGRLYFALTK